ncbi:MAG TPA: GNAT family N-acetyltransferase [Actinophytocola sp.]|uniref:GNAT family N-acetyltransferase n=1 Tax=Actinophytocola sp. TaxID=1872138 RepID=UPI002DDDA8A1|nr:GNAT family N-acetyltransferase [Actinophytocola sp.]HEV2781474.1 GNAT family N-acetyltransferase [Actinophytocola sp.]
MAYPDDVPVLTDGVVTLRPYALDDLDPTVENCVDPETVAWTTIPSPYNRDDAIIWITKTAPEGWETGTNLVFAIEAEHHDGVRRCAGGIGLLPGEEGVADIGFSVHPGARGRGVCRRAIKLIVDWGFAERDLEVILWYAFVGNWGSRKAVWANGFSFDGTVAELKVQRGERRDTWLGSLRATDTREPKTVWYDPPVLETDRLRLRPVVDSDAGRLFEMIHDERSLHWAGRIPAARPPTPAACVLRIREQAAAGATINWIIADRSTDVPLGRIQLFDLAGLDDTEVKPGYVIHPDARGRGILTEALRAVVDWTFRPVAAGGFGKRRITISTAATNTASRHAAEQAGFTHVCTNPTAFSLGESDFDDEVLYQVINPSWQP